MDTQIKEQDVVEAQDVVVELTLAELAQAGGGFGDACWL